LIEFIGEIDEDQKSDFLGNALALLFPIDWLEPFGLVMIEAMSAGTPVVAWRKGSVAEVMENGTSGFIVDTIEKAVAAVGKIGSIDRVGVRQYFESRFTVQRMARDYVAAYETMIAAGKFAGKSHSSRSSLRMAAE
jgi:glycosyltransferase involved in cell wall biosynthesis